jgi:hypothetical protein
VTLLQPDDVCTAILLRKHRLKYSEPPREGQAVRRQPSGDREVGGWDLAREAIYERADIHSRRWIGAWTAASLITTMVLAVEHAPLLAYLVPALGQVSILLARAPNNPRSGARSAPPRRRRP